MEVDEETAFSTPWGHYEFNRMPFELKAAPNTFTRLMNIVLSGRQGTICFCYLNDIVVMDHPYKILIRKVFGQLWFHNLKLQPDKYEFLREKIT